MTTNPDRRMDGFGSEDMALPELRLVQNVGLGEAKDQGAVPGDLFCTLTDEVFKEGLEIVIVDMQKTRTYWGRSEIFEEPPSCASMDADSMISMDGRDCKECEFRCDTPWLVSAAERRTKCLMNYNVLAIRYDTSMPLLIRTSGISTKAVRELLTQLRLNRTLKREYHRALIGVKSQQKKTAAGDAYAYSFVLKGLIPEADKVEEMRVLTTQILGTPIALPEGRELEPEIFEPEPEPEPPAPGPAESVAEKPAGSESKTEAKPAETKEKEATNALAKTEPSIDMNF